MCVGLSLSYIASWWSFSIYHYVGNMALRWSTKPTPLQLLARPILPAVGVYAPIVGISAQRILWSSNAIAGL